MVASTPLPVALASGLLFLAMLVLATVSDLRRRVIPNRVLLACSLPAVLLFALAVPASLPERAAAALAGGGALLALAAARPAAIGLGDVKMTAAMGLFLGARLVPALLLAFAGGAAVGAAMLIRHGRPALRMTIPLGPLLALGGVVVLFVAPLAPIAAHGARSSVREAPHATLIEVRNGLNKPRSLSAPMSANANSHCPICRTAEVVCGKWTLLIVRDLADRDSRFCELERSLEGISPRTLSLRLRALEEEGVVRRRTYPEVPPRVEYALTEKGEALIPLIEDMRQFGRRWMPDEVAAEPPVVA